MTCRSDNIFTHAEIRELLRILQQLPDSYAGGGNITNVERNALRKASLIRRKVERRRINRRRRADDSKEA